jgi:hypothetical protein
MNWQNLFYILAVINIIVSWLFLMMLIIIGIVINRKIKRFRWEIEIRRTTILNWIKFTPTISYLSYPVKWLLKRIF